MKLKMAKIEVKNFFVIRVLLISLLTFTITLCGGSGGGNKVDPPTIPVCTGGQALNSDRSACESCTEGEFPNINRTACVSSCPGGQIKPDNAETCVMEMVCTGSQVLNRSTNTCDEPTDCQGSDIPDMSSGASGCISISTCRSDTNKVVSTDGNACISMTACTTVARQVATRTGDCELCTGSTPTRSITLDSCLARCLPGQLVRVGEDTCETERPCSSGFVLVPATNTCEVEATCSGPRPFLNRATNTCLSSTNCTNMTGHVTTPGGECMRCEGATPFLNRVTNTCEVEATCSGPRPFLNRATNTCLSSTNCTNMTGHVATPGGECMRCEGATPIRNITLDSCLGSCPFNQLLPTGQDTCELEATCSGGTTFLNRETNTCSGDMDMDGVADFSDSCVDGVPGPASTTDRTAATADPDMDGCKNSEDDDDDGDGIPDTMDAFDHDACASVDTDSDGNPDSLVVGCSTTLMVDNDDDADAVPDASDNCPNVANTTQDDADTDEIGDACDECPSGATGPASTTDPTATDADPDGDGCKNSEDVDDDNDGLIEIATATDLNNIRHDVAGHSYDDEPDDMTSGNEGDTTGAPKSATTLCTSETTLWFKHLSLRL